MGLFFIVPRLKKMYFGLGEYAVINDYAFVKQSGYTILLMCMCT